MAIDKNAFIDHFLAEARENVDTIEASILVLKRSPENLDELTVLIRALHTLKGSARMLKFRVVESIVHGMENVLKGVKDGRYGIHENLVMLVFIGCNHLRDALQLIQTQKNDSLEVTRLLETFTKAHANEPFSLDWYQTQPTRLGAGAAPAPLPGGGSAAAATGADERSAHLDAAADSIRIKTERVDALLKSLNDLIIRQFQLKRESDSLGRIGELCQAVLASASRDGREPDGAAHQRELQLVKLIGDTRKNFHEQYAAVERGTLEVQKGLLGLRMLPVNLILGPLPAMVEETAFGLGKDIRLEITGSDLGLDRQVLEHLQDPVLHIVRNSLDHGIEKPDDRQRAGKARTGTIRIACSVEAGRFVMQISDDGRGFDYGAIRAKALALGLGSESELGGMDEQALNNLVFSPGFSTRDEADSLSGRGVGLDIVRHQLELIKGSFSVQSTAGQGCRFKLVLPLSLATVSGFFVEAAGRRCLIPATHIQEILIFDRNKQLSLLNQHAILLREKVVPVYHLGSLLDPGRQEESGQFHVVAVRYQDELIGVVVDRVLHHASLIYKPLPPGLSGIKPVQGFVFDEDFDMVSILEVPELIQRFKRRRSIDSQKRFSTDMAEYKHLLIVDDSFSTREIEKSILELEGYNIETAVDGIEALEILKTRHFHLIVTDINMPRMDGATLIENIRRDEKHRAIPIIVVSSERDTGKRQLLMSLGADSFLDKADFDRGNLAHEVRRLLELSAKAGGGRAK